MSQCSLQNEFKNLPNNSQQTHQQQPAQSQDFSKLFYQFTHKIDLSSSKIVDFYDNFLTQKLDLAEQHIDQISKLSMLQKPRKRIENPTAKSIEHDNRQQRKSQQLKKTKLPAQQEKSQKKVFDDKFMNELSKDLLQLDLDFMEDDYSNMQKQSSQKQQRKSNKKMSQRPLLSSQKSNNEQPFYVKINGNDIVHSSAKKTKAKAQSGNDEEDNIYFEDNNDIFKTRKSTKVEQQMINENSVKKSGNKNNLDAGNGNGKQFRKSLIVQFSEIKVKEKGEIQNEQQQIQEQVESINIEDFCQQAINPSFCQMQPEKTVEQNHQESLLLPGKSSTSASDDLQLQMNYNDSDDYYQINSMQPQQLPDGFYIHGNDHILAQEEEDNDIGYEMTDYSSNESSNIGSPVFNWVNKEEQACDKIFFNNDQFSSSVNSSNNPFNIPSNKFNSKNQNIFETCSSQQSDSNENSKGFNAINTDYFSQNTFGFGYNQPLYFDENSNSSQQAFRNITAFTSSQDSFQGMNFNNNNNKMTQQQSDIFSNQSNSNLIHSMNQESNNPYVQNKKLLYSPQKLKTVKQRKILYCNNKEVPSWAQDLKQVTQKVREQQAQGTDPVKLFGLFAVEGLILKEVFKNTGRRYDEGRGSSANWKSEYTPDQMIENLINATSQTPNRKQKMQSKLKSFLQNSINSIKNIKKKLIQ